MSVREANIKYLLLIKFWKEFLVASVSNLEDAHGFSLI